MITKTSDDILISSWALTKSVLFIGLIFVLLGLDQAIVRLKLNIKEIIFPALIQFFIISFLIATIIVLFTKKGQLNTPITIISLFLLASIYLIYAEHRLNLRYFKAQISVNGWKILFLLLIFFVGYSNFFIALPIAICVTYIIIFIDRGAFKLFKLISLEQYKRIIKTGLHYFVTLLTLTLTIYIDQIVLNTDRRILEASVLFSHITFFVSPNAILIGFGGFLLVPYLKKNPEKRIFLFKKYIYIYLLFVVTIVIISYFLGYVLFSCLKSSKDFSFYLALAMSTVAFLRYLYILPSSYIGSFASNQLIRKVAFLNLGGIAIYFLLYYLISRYSGNYLLAIVTAIIVVWSVRILSGFYAIFEMFKQHE